MHGLLQVGLLLVIDIIQTVYSLKHPTIPNMKEKNGQYKRLNGSTHHEKCRVYESRSLVAQDIERHFRAELSNDPMMLPHQAQKKALKRGLEMSVAIKEDTKDPKSIAAKIRGYGAVRSALSRIRKKANRSVGAHGLP